MSIFKDFFVKEKPVFTGITRGLGGFGFGGGGSFLTGPITFSDFMTTNTTWFNVSNENVEAFKPGSFNATGNTGGGRASSDGTITFDCSRFPLSGEIVWAGFYSTGSFVIEHAGGTTTFTNMVGVPAGDIRYLYTFNLNGVTEIKMVKTPNPYSICRGIKVNGTILIDGGNLT